MVTMSRTDKDRPYWVKVNAEGTAIDHDHLNFGREYYRDVYVKDKHGNLIYEDRPLYRTAYVIVHGPLYAWQRYGYSGIRYVNPGSVTNSRTFFNEARKATGSGLPDKEILVGWYRAAKTERILYKTVADHCTGAAPVVDWKRQKSVVEPYVEAPCTKALSEAQHESAWHNGGYRGYGVNMYHRSRRSEKRDMLKGVAKHYNAGFEVDDYDEVEKLTAPVRRGWWD